MACSRTGIRTKALLNILIKLDRLHEKFGDFWWYSFMLFVALRVGDIINAIVGLWLVPKYVEQEELGAVLPLTQFAASIGAPITVLVTVFTKFLNKFKTISLVLQHHITELANSLTYPIAIGQLAILTN